MEPTKYPQAFRMGGWQVKECIIITLAWSPVHPTKPYHHQLADGSHLIGVLEWRVTLIKILAIWLCSYTKLELAILYYKGLLSSSLSLIALCETYRE